MCVYDLHTRECLQGGLRCDPRKASVSRQALRDAFREMFPVWLRVPLFSCRVRSIASISRSEMSWHLQNGALPVGQRHALIEMLQSHIQSQTTVTLSVPNKSPTLSPKQQSHTQSQTTVPNDSPTFSPKLQSHTQSQTTVPHSVPNYSPTLSSTLSPKQTVPHSVMAPGTLLWRTTTTGTELLGVLFVVARDVGNGLTCYLLNQPAFV